jgi:hypothetical protein
MRNYKRKSRVGFGKNYSNDDDWFGGNFYFNNDNLSLIYDAS